MTEQPDPSRKATSIVSRLRYYLLGFWLLFTLSLTAWWYIFSTSQLEKLRLLQHDLAPELVKNQKMLALEGLTLIACVLAGAIAILYYMYREVAAYRRLRSTFVSFSHELKTPVAALKLNAESLVEDLEGSDHIPLALRVLESSSNLALQIENSLMLAQVDDYRPYFETLNLSETIDQVRQYWPKVEFKVEPDVIIKSDRKAFECICSNIIQNAVTHGKADTIEIRTKPIASKETKVAIQFWDNGRGSQGKKPTLGKLFQRLYPGSGSGVGLFLCKKLSDAIGARLKILKAKKGFGIELVIEGQTI